MFRDELKYILFSGALYALIGVLLLLVGMNAYSNYTYFRSSLSLYEATRAEMLALGQDVDAALERELNVTEVVEGDGVIKEVDNPVRYEFEQVARSIQAFDPRNLISSAIAVVAFLGGPLVFGVWGVFLATYDFANKTVKLRAVRYKWARLVATKLGVGVLGVAFSVVFIMLVSVVLGPVFRWWALSAVPDYSVFLAATQATASGADLFLTEVAVAVLVGTLFMSLGFAMGIAFRNPYPPLAVVVVYNMFVPVLGRLDLKNLVAVIGNDTFSFSGVFQLLPARELSVPVAYAIILCIIAIALVSSLVIARRQSKYVV